MAAVLMPELAAFLREGAARPFTWGACDCCTFACAWIAHRRGVDPSRPWRGRYRSLRGALRQIRRGGGDLLAVAADAMRVAGLDVTSVPQPGDVGIVRTPAGLALAIRTPLGWAGKSESGVVTAPYPCLRAWSV